MDTGGWLSRVATNHDTLSHLAAEGPAEPAAVMQLGLAVLAHGFIEERWLFTQPSLVDPLVISGLVDEHARIAEDIELLRSLGEAGDEGDRRALAASLLARLREHVAREGRIVYERLRGYRS